MGHEKLFTPTARACTLIILTVVLSLSAFSTTAAQNTPASTHSVAPDRGSGNQSSWSALTVAQQQALAPLAADWNNLDSAHRTKWLAIGNKFSSMKPGERSRIQDRMREWVKLSPQQKHIARENFWRAKKIDPRQKNAHWQAYQQLPEEQKKRLAIAGSGKKKVPSFSIARKNKEVFPANPPKNPVQSGQTDNKDSSILTPSMQSDKK
ncbi:MAG: DUF3106 domain-containing protein [Burkholderiaceae bacterium]